MFLAIAIQLIRTLGKPGVELLIPDQVEPVTLVFNFVAQGRAAPGQLMPIDFTDESLSFEQFERIDGFPLFFPRIVSQVWNGNVTVKLRINELFSVNDDRPG